MMTYNLMGTLVVLAQFPNTPDKDYSYFVPQGDNPEIGDVILTSTSWDTFNEPHAQHRYQEMALEARLARIVDVLPDGHPKATRFYMKLLKVADLKATHERNRQIAEQARQRAAAYKQLDAMLARRSRIDQYRHLATNDPEAAKLLAMIEGK